MKEQEDVFPIAWITRNRHVLFVGGGKVALAKLQRLAEHRCTITVLAPKIHPEIQTMAVQGLVRIRADSYRTDMLEGSHLVFAATCDSDLNATILQDARHSGIPACAVDGNWRDGDFITPAIARGSHGIAAFTTGGRSYRIARLVNGSIQRQLDATNNWMPVVIGTSHLQLNLKHLGEILCRDTDNMKGRCLEELRGIHEFMLLTTCNRVEFYGLVSIRDITLSMIRTHLGFKNLKADEFYELYGFDALSHMTQVGSGILSQTPGENHIVSQLKNAIHEAEKQKWAGPYMKDWLSKALHVSRNIRKGISPYLKYRDIENLVTAYMEYISPGGGKILLMGSGVIGRSIAEELNNRSHPFTWAYHSRPPLPPDGVSILPIKPEELKANGPSDIVISALSLQDPLKYKDFEGILKPGGWAIDLGVPRNLDAEWKKNHSLTDLEDLKHWYRRNMADLQTIRKITDKEIESHRENYEKLISTL